MLKGNIQEGCRMRLGVDIDNTVANLNEDLVRRYNVSLDVYPSPDLPVGFFSTEEGLELLVRVKPLPGAAEVLRSLSRAGHEILYMTSRPVLAINFTREWLKAWGFPRGGIVFVPRGFKKMFAACYGIDVFFEDDPGEALGLQEVIGRVYMLQWPYNKSVESQYIDKFTFWEEILARINCHSQNRMVL